MNKVLKYILIAIGLVLLIYILWYFKNLVAYILISAVLALIGKPIVHLLNRIKIGKFQLTRGLSAGLTLFFLWTVLIVFLRVFIPLLAKEANDLSSINVESITNTIEGPIKAFEEFASDFKLNKQGDFTVENYVQEKLASLFNFTAITNLFSSVAGLLGNIFIAIFAISFITFFFLKEEDLFLEAIITLVPNRYEEPTKHAILSIRHLLMRYFIGICLQILAIITLVTAGLTLVGVGFQHSLVIGLFVGIVNVIPYLGPIIGIVVGVILGVATHLQIDFYTELLPLVGYMVLVFISVQVADNVLFQPLIFSSSVNAHPLEIFLVIMIAGSLAGIIGMILAIPTYTILRVFAKEFFNKFKVVKKLTKKI